jgi:hypothetical protein
MSDGSLQRGARQISVKLTDHCDSAKVLSCDVERPRVKP